MSIHLSYRRGKYLGTGSSGIVYRAVENEDPGRAVALKKSRVPQRIKRTNLRYESRVLQLLQGHPAIPQIYGYGHLTHFEYLAMELLGPSIRERYAAPISVKTVVRVVLQMLSALEHVHRHGFIHRNIKPENMLCSLTDPAKIFLIDFGISSRIKPPPPSTHDPLANSRHIIGTLHWASINAHNGIDLAPRDDLESLAYTAFYLLYGDLPWRTSKFDPEPLKMSMKCIHASKSAVSGHGLSAGFPGELGFLLEYSRSLEFDQFPNYADLFRQFSTLLDERVGAIYPEGPLDWSKVAISEEQRCVVSDSAHVEDNNISMESDESDNDNVADLEEYFTGSYLAMDIALWDTIHGERDKSLTLPNILVEMEDSSIPEIVEVKVANKSSL